MKGIKIRVPDAPAYTIFPKAVGANPTPIAFAEVYLALQSGVVDAQENPLPTILAKKFYEVQSHICLTGHITDSLLITVAGHVWKKLNDADKKMFTDIWNEAGEKITARHPAVGEGTRVVVREAGQDGDQGRRRPRHAEGDRGLLRCQPQGSSLGEGRLGAHPGAQQIALTP